MKQQIINILDNTPETDENFFLIEEIRELLELFDLEMYIEQANNFRNILPSIPIYIPEQNKQFELPINPLDKDLFRSTLNPHNYMELVRKTDPQKIAFKIYNFGQRSAEIREKLKEYLNLLGYDANIGMTKVMNGYEIIINDLWVNNSDERVEFVRKFKKYIFKDDYILAGYINVNDSFTEEEYDYWLSINTLKRQNQYEPADNKLINKITSTGINISEIKQSTPENLFIEYIKENRPEWYVPDSWIHIDIFHEKYLPFDSITKRTSFTRKFKNILWINKKEIKKKTHYQLLNLWEDNIIENDERAGYIYLIKEREFIKTGENIYKIGKTVQKNCRRLQQYPKGSKLIIVIPCTNCHQTEKEIISSFKENFLQRKDIGTEYFEGDLEFMLSIMKNYF